MTEDTNTKKESEKEEWISSILIAVIAAIIIRIFVFAPTIVKGPSMEPTLYGNHRLLAERWSYFLNIKPDRGDIITFTEPSSEYYVVKSPLKKVFHFFTKREYIKRVIGVEGDHLEIKGEYIIANNGVSYDFDIRDRKVFVNGEPLTGDQSATIKNACVYINGEKLEESYITKPWDVSISIENGSIIDGRQLNGRIGGEDVNLDVQVPKGYVYVMGDNRNDSSDSRKFSPARNDYTTVDGCISLKEASGRVILRFWPLDKFGTFKKR